MSTNPHSPKRAFPNTVDLLGDPADQDRAAALTAANAKVRELYNELIDDDRPPEERPPECESDGG